MTTSVPSAIRCSTVVKEMVRYGVELSDFIPREIIEDVKKKMNDSRRDV